MKFVGGLQGVDLKLQLIKKLTVSIIVLHNAKGLLLVHFMFLYLLDFIFLIFVQDVPLKLKLIFLDFLDVAHAVVEVRRHEPLEVGHVHKLRFDCFYHFFIEIEFKHILVLFAQSNYCREQ